MEELGNQEDLKHVCKLCSKKFRCGKSLGGHMRSHVMAAKAQKRKSKKAVKQDNEVKQNDNGVELSRETPKKQEGDDNVASENGDGSSSVHPEDDEKIKEVATLLVEFSRDSFSRIVEPSDSNS
ncbi:unnamed protein product [Amaranthus hypochondriacus]